MRVIIHRSTLVTMIAASIVAGISVGFAFGVFVVTR